jgi:hypothetical protein
MSDVLKTQITLKDSKATGLSSRAHGANIDGVAFNIGFIAQKNPVLATNILKNYKEAATLSPDDPEHPDEDFDLVIDALKDF